MLCIVCAMIATENPRQPVKPAVFIANGHSMCSDHVKYTMVSVTILDVTQALVDDKLITMKD